MELRNYQQQAIDGAYKSWGTYRKVLEVLPTGSGKTIIFAHITKREVEEGNRVLILCHRDELIRQAQDKLMRATGLSAAIEKADETAEGSLFPITIGSVQTLMRTKRLEHFEPDHYDVIICDEAHHCLAPSWMRILNHFTGRFIGFSATPDRSDARNLGQFFEDIAFEYSLRTAIADGYLCKIKAQTIPLDIDLTKVRVTAGDFNDADLGTALDPYLPEIAARIPADRKTLIFLPLIVTSEKLTKLLQVRGLKAEHICGVSEDRREILKRYTSGETQVLCNSMLLTEGYDESSISCVVCLRPTKVRSLYAQMIGRGTRIHPGKDNLLILDFLWHTAKHELCHPANLIAEKAETAKKMQEIQDAAAGCPDEQAMLELGEMETRAKKEVIREREKALAEELKSHQKKSGRTIDPLEFALSLHDSDLQDYEPTMPWQRGPASEKQIACLEKFGFGRDAIPNCGFASMLMDKIISRSKANLATPKQVKLLEKFRVLNANELTFQNARELIDRIAANGWRRVA